MKIFNAFFSSSWRWYYPLRFALLILLGLIIYAKTFGFGFVFDDNFYILDTPYIKNFQNVHLIWGILPKTRLIGVYSLALNYQLNHTDPAGYHIFNFIIHLFTTALVWALASKLFKITGIIAKELPFIIALLFLVHPLQTQAVSYISQRFESMATMFYLASIYSYLCARTTGLSLKKIAFLTLTAAFALLGIFTKETAVTIPLMILAAEFILFRNNRKFYVPIIISCALFAVLLMKIVHTNFIDMYFHFTAPSHSHSGDIITSGRYLLTQSRVFLTFCRLLVLPIHQTLDYDYPLSTGLLSPPLTLAGLALIGLLVFLIARLRQKMPLISFGLAWILITFSINTAPRVNIIFEHKLYLISFGFFLAFVCALPVMIKDRRILIGLLLTLVAVLSWVSFQRNQVWKNDFTLWSDVARKSPQKARAYNGIGIYLGSQGDFKNAITNFNKAIALNPHYTECYNNRGNTYAKMGNYPQANADLNKAIELNPSYAQAYANRANMYGLAGKLSLAISDYNKAIGLDPYLMYSRYNRGIFLDRMGNHQEAISNYDKDIEMIKDNAQAYNNRGISNYTAGDLVKAMADYDEAIKINPRFADSYYNRGIVFNQEGLALKALSDFSKAIELDPEFEDAYFNRGLLLAQQGGLLDAIIDFSSVLRINPKNTDGYLNRGDAFIKESDFDQAILDFNHVLEIKPANARAYFSRGFCYFKKGDLTNSLSDYNKAIALNPHYADAYIQRSKVYNLLKEYDKALVDMNKVKSLGIKS